MNTQTNSCTRRRFLAGATAAMAAPYFIPLSALGGDGRTAASDRICVGVIAAGGRGNDHLNMFLNDRGTQVMAVCDPQRLKSEAARSRANGHYAAELNAGTYKGCTAHADFREIIMRDDIDAVSIASPEFWHALHAIGAMRHRKDVYCEKAMTLTHAEGQAVVQTVRRHQRVYQLGTQQRSDRNFRFACELARNGYLGKLHTVKVAVPGGRDLPNAPPKPPPPNVDYDMWLGPAPYTPYNDAKCSFNWYFMHDYCIGWIGSWGVHHIDIALWGAPALRTGPVEIEGTAIFPTEGLADTSKTWRVNVTTADGLKLFFTDDSGQPHGARFEGDQGWVHVVRGGIQANPPSLLKLALKPDDEHLYVSNSHHGNFLECIRTRRDPVSNVEAGHAATTMTIVCDIATRLGRKVTWDWKAERFQNDDVANAMLARPMRSPWVL
jgi:predicted dehydrogenase